MSLTSLPPTVTLPSVTSKNLGMRLMSVVLPHPVDPMMAVVSPGLASKSISVRTFSSASGYMKLTCSNLTVPSVLPFMASAPSLSLMDDSVLMTSYILSAAMPALGRNIAMLAIMRKEKTISIE